MNNDEMRENRVSLPIQIYKYLKLYYVLISNLLFFLAYVLPRYGIGSYKARQFGSRWAGQFMKVLGFKVHFSGHPFSNKACLHVSNHWGFLDVLLWMSEANVAFVAKKQILYWPFFGRGALGIGTIFVKRDSPRSRAETLVKLKERIIDQNISVVIFPEGTSSIEGKPWKKGSFEMARECKIPVQAGCVTYLPVRDCAYIEHDHFVKSLWRLCRFQHIEAFLTLHETCMIHNTLEDMNRLQDWVKKTQHEKLHELGYFQKTLSNLPV